MTVRELIEKLKEMPVDLPVAVEGGDHGDGYDFECFSLEVKSGEYWTWSNLHNGPYVKMF